MRLIRTCPGIGDSIWLFMKLINCGEKFDFHISANKPQRGKQVFDMMPSIANSCTYAPGLSYAAIRAGSQQFDGWNFSDIKMNGFSLECNKHLEDGKRIEKFLPDLPTSFMLDYDTTGHDFNEYMQYGRINIGIYGSAYSTSRSWDGWGAVEWFDLIEKIHATEPGRFCFWIIGAEWDLDLAGDLIPRLQKNNIPYVNTVGKKMPYVVELLKSLDYFIGFPSGLTILNETLGKKTFMFYPKHLLKMMFAWPEPSRIAESLYMASMFTDPIHVFNRINDETSLLR